MKRISMFLLVLVCFALTLPAQSQVIRISYPLWINSTVTNATSDTLVVTGFVFPFGKYPTMFGSAEQAVIPDSVRLAWSATGNTAADSVGAILYMAFAMIPGTQYTTFSAFDSLKVASNRTLLVTGVNWTDKSYIKVARIGQVSPTKNGYLGGTIKSSYLEFFYH